MVVKEVKDKIEELRNDYSNLIKLQNWIMQNQNNQIVKNAVETIEDGANVNLSIRCLCSSVAMTIDGEVKRLEKIIDNTPVKIN